MTRSNNPSPWNLRILAPFGIFLLLWHPQQKQLVAMAFAAPFPSSASSSSSLPRASSLRTNSLLQSRHLPNSLSNHHSISRRRHATTSLIPRGGAAASSIMSGITAATSTPASLFHTSLLTLGFITVMMKVIPAAISKTQGMSTTTTTSSDESSSSPPSKKPAHVLSLQVRFLLVFWLLRCADWLQGPYFYEVYASKTAVMMTGTAAAAATVAMARISQLFLTGFASRAILGPSLGRWSDDVGRKRGTLACCLIYAMGALSTQSQSWAVLVAGRILGGMGTALLFSAPESWLVGEAQKPIIVRDGDDGQGDKSSSSSTSNSLSYLGQTFGWAYAGDSVVAILAGQMAGFAASLRGPTGPFELSTVFLGLGAMLTLFLWKENRAERQQVEVQAPTDDSESSPKGEQAGVTIEANEVNEATPPDTETTSSPPPPPDSDTTSFKPSIRDAIEVVKSDPKIILVGAVQSLFEAAMYIFVLQWPPAMRAVITKAFDSSASVPYGTIFSCFMACCLIGSTLFGQLVNNSRGAKNALTQEQTTSWMLTVAALAMTGATFFQNSLTGLVAAFFVFEACVGMYFPSIGLLRSKYVPDSHRTVIMNLFGIPLNVLVVTVFLSIHRLGLQGALAISSTALALAAVCMFRLRAMTTTTSATKTAGNTM